MGERLLCKQEVIGSNPFTSTTVATSLRPRDRRCRKQRRKWGRAAPVVCDVRRSTNNPGPGPVRAGVLIEG